MLYLVSAERFHGSRTINLSIEPIKIYDAEKLE